jgi:hypothetical protein
MVDSESKWGIENREKVKEGANEPGKYTYIIH